MVVLTPADPDRFNGTVLVEWLNVSGGIDAPAVWMMAHREMVRAGYAYVAVSAQRVGVEGGANLIGADLSLKRQDPTRYASLHHPGDAFSYDIFSQTGRLIKDAQRDDILRGLRPEHVVALGESQSALYLTTYINAVDALAQVYDGFLVHSRFASAAPLDASSIFDATETNTPPPSNFVPTYAFRCSRLSPKQTFSAVCARAITWRGSPTTTGCESGRFPAPRTLTTTQSK